MGLHPAQHRAQRVFKRRLLVEGLDRLDLFRGQRDGLALTQIEEPGAYIPSWSENVEDQSTSVGEFLEEGDATVEDPQTAWPRCAMENDRRAGQDTGRKLTTRRS